MLMRVMFEDRCDPTESVHVLSHSEMDRAVAYMWMDMHDRVDARKDWWDNQELVTWKFEKDDATGMDHLVDQYNGPIGFDPPKWVFPRLGDKIDEFQHVAENFR